MVQAEVVFSIPDEALREGESKFVEEMTDNLEFWFDVPVDVVVSVVERDIERKGRETECADIDLEFSIPDESVADLTEESIEEILLADLESFFSVPITATIEQEAGTESS